MTTITLSGSFSGNADETSNKMFAMVGSFTGSAIESAANAPALTPTVTKVFTASGVACSSTPSLVTLAAFSDMVASGSAATQFQVADNKTFVLQNFAVTWLGTTITQAVACRLAITGSGATLDLNSPTLVTVQAAGGNAASTSIQNGVASTSAVSWPEGIRFPSGVVFGVSVTCTRDHDNFDVSLIGYEE